MLNVCAFADRPEVKHISPNSSAIHISLRNDNLMAWVMQFMIYHFLSVAYLHISSRDSVGFWTLLHAQFAVSFSGMVESVAVEVDAHL